MINAKVIKTTDYMVNLCDSELIGLRVNDCLVSENFYGSEMSDEEIIQELKQATIINALGTKAVGLVKQVFGEVRTVIVDGLLHAQVITVYP